MSPRSQRNNNSPAASARWSWLIIGARVASSVCAPSAGWIFVATHFWRFAEVINCSAGKRGVSCVRVCVSPDLYSFICVILCASIAFYLRLALRIIPCSHPFIKQQAFLYVYVCVCVCLHQILLLLLLFAILAISQRRHAHKHLNSWWKWFGPCRSPLKHPSLCARSAAIEVFNIVLYFIMHKFTFCWFLNYQQLIILHLCNCCEQHCKYTAHQYTHTHPEI